MWNAWTDLFASKANGGISGIFKCRQVSHRAGEATRSWSVPPRGVIKVNTDAAHDANNNTAGLGMVARNDEGIVICSALKRVSNVILHWQQKS
ncbi:hypothetical protein REPUB_Repub06bG0094100 [Reevesia pubescens]